MRGTFVGRIHPTIVTSTVAVPIPTRIDLNDRPISATIRLQGPDVLAEIHDDFPATELPDLLVMVRLRVRTITNYVALVSSCFQLAVFDTFVDAATGEALTIDHREPLDELSDDVRNVPLHFRVLHTQAVRQALDSYNNALKEPDYTAKYCREAIEAVREHWGKGKWAVMHSCLNLTQDTLCRHNDAANDQKHGRNRVQSWQVRRDQLVIARECINRLMAYLDRGEPLSVTDYPVF